MCTQLMSDSRDLELLVCQFAGANETTYYVATNVYTQWTPLCTYKLYISSKEVKMVPEECPLKSVHCMCIHVHV